MRHSQSGLVVMILACIIWGLSPLFYDLIAHVPPLEVLAHRTIWSSVLILAMLSWQKRLGQIKQAFAAPRAVFITVFAAVMIAINWAIFIFSVQVGRVTESAMGYYIFPLVAVLLGTVLLGERLSRLQWVAIGFATLACLILGVGLSILPWIPLTLALTFGLYGLVKKGLAVGPLVSVLAEVLVLAPIALAVIWIAQENKSLGPFAAEAGFFTQPRDMILLMLTGPMTAIPLILMARALKTLNLSTTGIVQYINPSLQFLAALLILGEPLSGLFLIALCLIWTGLGFYSVDLLRRDAAAPKP